jgi:hypothetical protein
MTSHCAVNGSVVSVSRGVAHVVAFSLLRLVRGALIVIVSAVVDAGRTIVIARAVGKSEVEGTESPLFFTPKQSRLHASSIPLRPER